jgi:nitronate monooxygenase
MASFRNTSRVMINEYAHKVQHLENAGVDDFDQYWEFVKGSNAYDAYKTGDWNKALLSMGQAAAFANSIVPMEEIYDKLIDEATEAIGRISALTQ